MKLVLNLVLVGGKCFVELIFTLDFSSQLLLTLCCYLDQVLQLVCEYLLIFLKHINFHHPNLLHVVLLHLLQLLLRLFQLAAHRIRQVRSRFYSLRKLSEHNFFLLVKPHVHRVVVVAQYFTGILDLLADVLQWLFQSLQLCELLTVFYIQFLSCLQQLRLQLSVLFAQTCDLLAEMIAFTANFLFRVFIFLL